MWCAWESGHALLGQVYILLSVHTHMQSSNTFRAPGWRWSNEANNKTDIKLVPSSSKCQTSLSGSFCTSSARLAQDEDTRPDCCITLRGESVWAWTYVRTIFICFQVVLPNGQSDKNEPTKSSSLFAPSTPQAARCSLGRWSNFRFEIETRFRCRAGRAGGTISIEIPPGAEVIQRPNLIDNCPAPPRKRKECGCVCVWNSIFVCAVVVQETDASVPLLPCSCGNNNVHRRMVL